MKPEFLEDVAHHLDPLDGRASEFDWNELIRSLGEDGDDLSDLDYEAMGIALRRLLQWLVTVGHAKPRKMAEMVGRRTLALAWVLDPGIIEGTPSLSSLARRIGTSKAVLSLSSAKVSKEFGISNRAQAHAWNRKYKNGRRLQRRKPERTA